MNYSKIYVSLIHNRIVNPITNNLSEKHHIIPKCCGGSNNKNNLVSLSYREHYIAHLLLSKIYKNTIFHKYLLLAIYKMCNDKKCKYNSKIYEKSKKYLKEIHLFYDNGKNGGKNCWIKHKKDLCDKISKALSIRTYICNICGEKLISTRKLHSHIQTQHRNMCYYCKKEFENYRIKNAHMLHCKLHPKYRDNYKKLNWTCKQ